MPQSHTTVFMLKKLSINVKMPTGILTIINRINTTSESSNARKLSFQPFTYSLAIEMSKAVELSMKKRLYNPCPDQEGFVRENPVLTTFFS